MKIDFKLNELNLHLLNDERMYRNLNLFLKSQSDSIEILKTNSWMDVEVMNTILSMPRLTYLALDEKTYDSPGKLAAENFPQNHSVTSLDLSNHRIYETTDLILKLFPKVKNLKLPN